MRLGLKRRVRVATMTVNESKLGLKKVIGHTKMMTVT